jgi:tetratricopeptide (TPR) repeat protein
LIELGQYEDAVVAYDAVLRLDTSLINAYIGKGQAFNGLERYNDALAVLEEALRLDPESANVHISKGQALYGLERYMEALLTFDNALRLNRNSAEAYRGKGRTLSRLGRYAEASEVFEQANKLDPQHEDGAEVKEDVEKIRNKPQQRHGSVTTGQDSKAFPGRLTKPFRSSPHSAQRGAHPFWNVVSNSFAVLVVGIIIVVSVLIFHSSVRTSIDGLGSYATATA